MHTGPRLRFPPLLWVTIWAPFVGRTLNFIVSAGWYFFVSLESSLIFALRSWFCFPIDCARRCFAFLFFGHLEVARQNTPALGANLLRTTKKYDPK